MTIKEFAMALTTVLLLFTVFMQIRMEIKLRRIKKRMRDKLKDLK